MHPLAILLILVDASAVTVLAGSSVASTTAARFWEKALPGTPLPKAIADLLQKGVYDSQLVESYSLRACPDKQACKPLPLAACNGCGATVWWSCVHDCPAMAAVPRGLFFNKAQVRVGSTLSVSLPSGVVPAILPRSVADKVPFGNLSDVLSMFNISPNSREASMVAGTLNLCRASSSALSGDEQKLCSTSLESTVQNAMRMLGTIHMWAVASALPEDDLPYQRYVIKSVRPLNGDSHVSCHVMPYPYAVYDCHMTTALQSEAYVISLHGVGKGEMFDMAAMCHLNTSKWNPAYPAFEILHTQPGGAPVCHFLQYGNLIFGNKAGHA